jgi:hypothetical protein
MNSYVSQYAAPANSLHGLYTLIVWITRRTHQPTNTVKNSVKKLVARDNQRTQRINEGEARDKAQLKARL